MTERSGIDEERRFASAAIARGFASRAAVDEAVRKQWAGEQEGQLLRLWDLLIESRAITPTQAEAAFESIGKSYRFCPACRQRHRAASAGPSGHIQCGHCGHTFEAQAAAPRSGRTVMQAVSMPAPPEVAATVDLDHVSDIGPYRITGLISRYEHSRVFRAIQTFAARDVAIRVEQIQELAAREDQTRRFLDGVRLAAPIEHEHVLRIYDAGEFRGLLFLVTEYVDGPDVASILALTGVLDGPEVASLVLGVSKALGFAARFDVAHGDLCPHDVLRGRTGAFKLANLGLVPFIWREDQGVRIGGMDVPGDAFRAPERSDPGRPADFLADQFSLGVLAYVALTGEAPFDPRDLDLDRPKAPVAPHKRFHDVPRVLSKAVMRMIELLPKDRFPDPAALEKEANRVWAKVVGG